MLYILILVWLAITVFQGHASAKKQKLLTKFSVSFKEIWYTVETYGVMNLMLMLFYPFDFQGRLSPGENPTSVISLKRKKTLTLACIQTYTDQFLSEFVWW